MNSARFFHDRITSEMGKVIIDVYKRQILTC